MGPNRRVLNGIVHQIDNDLDDKSGITFGKKQLVFVVHCDRMLFLLSADMLQRFSDDLFNQVGLHFQLHSALFDLCNCQQVFHQIGQPCGIVIDITAHLPNGIIVQLFQIRKQHTCVARDGSQRCAQIVRNGAQEIGTKLFLLSLQFCIFHLLRIAAVFQSHGAFAKDGEQHAVLKCFQRFCSLNDDRTINPVLDLNGILQRILATTYGYSRQYGCVTAQKLCNLGSDCLEDLIVRSSLLQHLVGFKQQICTVCCLCGLPCLSFQSVRHRADRQGRNEHNQESQRCAVCVHTKRESRISKEEIKYQDASNGRQHIAASSGSEHGYQQNCQQVYSYDVCFAESKPGRQKRQTACQGQDPQRNAPIPEGCPKIHPPFDFLRPVRRIRTGIRDDVDINMGCDLCQLFCQGGFAEESASGHSASAHNDLRHAGQPRILRDLIGNIVTKDRFNGCAQFLCQIHILMQTLLVCTGHSFIIGCADKQRCQTAFEGFCHSCSCANDPGIGRS